MKNQLTSKMPEDTCSREVVSGSLWTGDVFGRFISKGGKKVDCQKPHTDLKLCKELDKDHLPLIISKIEAVSQALYLEICESPNEPNMEALRGLHHIIEDVVGEFKIISNQLCGDTSLPGYGNFLW